MLPVFINLLRRLYFMRASRESAAYHSLPKEGIFMDQSRAPIMEALENFKDMRIVPFDVPGHKRGRGSPELTKFLGQQCMTVDVNSMKPLDNLCHPTSVIREAEELAADAFGAALLIRLDAFQQIAYVLYFLGEFLLQCGTFLFAEVHELADGFLDGSPYGCPFLLVQFFHFRTGHDVRQAQ